MTETTDTRVWTCPICTEQVEVGLTWKAKGIGMIKVLHVDDMDARLHMAWHQMCTCEWDHVHTDNRVDPVHVTRQQGVDCPMHP